MCKSWEGERHEFAIWRLNSKLLFRANSYTVKIDCCQEKYLFHSAAGAQVLKFWLFWELGKKASWSISIRFNWNSTCWFIHWKAFVSWLGNYLFNKLVTRSSKILLVLSARNNRGKNYFEVDVGTLKFFQGFKKIIIYKLKDYFILFVRDQHSGLGL